MLTHRFILIALLVLAPATGISLRAQDKESVTPATSPTEEASKKSEVPPEPFKITIAFKATDGDKVITQRSYTIVSSTGIHADPPRIRDGSRVPVPVQPGNSTQFNYQDINTNVDINSIRKSGNLISINLNISTEDFSNSQVSPGISSITAPVRHSHSYSVSPTLALNKLTTVYSSTDSVNNTTVDVQVRVEPATTK